MTANLHHQSDWSEDHLGNTPGGESLRMFTEV